MLVNRRGLLAGVIALAAAMQGAPALALTEGEAKAHVAETLDELIVLLRQAGKATSRAPELRRIMESRANLPLIARFSAGASWRSMSEAQQTQFIDAFSHYLSIVYSRRFDEYAGDPKFEIGRALDAGKKGFLIESPIALPGREPVAVEWLVSDRAGAVQIVDLVIEGISLAATQREEMASMLERRNGDVDALIANLAATN